MDRKELILSAESPKVDEEMKLRSRVEEMYFLKALTELRGWKDIIAPYINGKLSLDRFLQTKTPQERNETWGALNELDQFVSFLKKKISDGETAAKILNKKNE